jgi:hypothetical protein
MHRKQKEREARAAARAAAAAGGGGGGGGRVEWAGSTAYDAVAHVRARAP